MRILMINTHDKTGGAAVATYRLHKALQKIGIESRMLVQRKVTDDNTVMDPGDSLQKIMSYGRSYLDNGPLYFLYKNREKSTFSIGWVPSNVNKHINSIHPDIIHLNWINGGFVPITALKKIKQPIIWTLHDMWAFTGGCHYAGDCIRYSDNCEYCPQLHSHSSYDISSWILKRKKKYWKDANMTVVTPSKWLAKCAEKSSLFRNKTIRVIPYGIDTTVFKPIPKEISRDILNLPHEKKLILFGAMNPLGDERKGFSYLKKGMQLLEKNSNSDEMEVIIFGASQSNFAHKFKFPVHYIGKVSDDTTLSLVYSAADVFVAPSLQENLANTVIESLACGTPVVAFNIGGMPDMIDHKVNGYLVQSFEYQDLAEGIAWVLNEGTANNYLSSNSREKVLENYEDKISAQRYKELFNEVLEK